MTSSRFGIVVSILLAVALVPTIIHNYIGAKVEDGLLASAVSTELAGLPSMPRPGGQYGSRTPMTVMIGLRDAIPDRVVKISCCLSPARTT